MSDEEIILTVDGRGRHEKAVALDRIIQRERSQCRASVEHCAELLALSQARERRLRDALVNMCEVVSTFGAKLYVADVLLLSTAIERATDALSSPVAEQKHPDSERLDWINASMGDGCVFMFTPYYRYVCTGSGEDIRAAIDAARQKGPQ